MVNIPQDPIMLFSLVNMKLRDEYDSLEEMCKDMDIEYLEIINRLKAAGFEYFPEINQFR